ncbi:MAG: alkyl hydroperoxide reductase [Phycisphaeraceae bacterium]|nr:alkyl hydroperoxide reductase [Phycisphaeraceae bacterium]
MPHAANPTPPAPRWMRATLVIAGIYNLLWGAAVVLFPTKGFDLVGIAYPDDFTLWIPIWQCLGMVIGVFGVGYLAASRDPITHWPITLVGFLGKVFGPIGFVYFASTGQFPWSFGWTILTNDLVWWVPFGLILLAAWRRHHPENA